ncbi:dTDP-4-dehydrorhamnose reductase [bacterium]|nr:dTDP-4-dehydrorhamnose reductase [bacterium]
MLGTDLLAALLRRNWSVDSPWMNDLDITNPQHLEKIRRRDIGPYTHIINCAAYTAVDKAESEAMAAMRINAVAPGLLAFAARETGAKFIHISTDFVFDGFAQNPYTEADPPNPLGVYGKSKLQGEQNAIKENDQTIIFRTSWLYGAHGPCFPRTMITHFLKGTGLKVVNDQTGCPTSTVDLSESICQAIELSIPAGIYHATGGDQATWFQFAQLAISTYREMHQLPNEIKLAPCTTADYPTPARRPAYSVLNTAKLESTGVSPHRPFPESLLEYCSRVDLTPQ